MFHKMSLLTAAVASVAVLGACEKTKTEEERATTERVQTAAPNGPAIASIIEARCEREARCENIGPEKRFLTRAACVEHVRDNSQNKLNTKDCPGGIDSKALDSCLKQIKDEDCGDPIETVERVATCNSVDLCVASR
jgi:hypothetical protein